MDNDGIETYVAHLSERQWRVIISALAESGCEEAEELANDLLLFTLP
jgi:hypothetical protein